VRDSNLRKKCKYRNVHLASFGSVRLRCFFALLVVLLVRKTLKDEIMDVLYSVSVLSLHIKSTDSMILDLIIC